MPTIHAWKAYRSGHDVRVAGLLRHGADVKVAVSLIELTPDGLIATTREGKRYRLVTDLAA